MGARWTVDGGRLTKIVNGYSGLLRSTTTIYRLPSTVYRLPSTLYRLIIFEMKETFAIFVALQDLSNGIKSGE